MVDRILKCPRRIFEAAERIWQGHWKTCAVCNGEVEAETDFCDEGSRLLDADIDAWDAQNVAGCNILMCKEFADDCVGKPAAELDSPNFKPKELKDFEDRGYDRQNRHL